MTTSAELLGSSLENADRGIPRVLQTIYGVQNVRTIDPEGARIALQLAIFFQDPEDYRGILTPQMEADHAA